MKDGGARRPRRRRAAKKARQGARRARRRRAVRTRAPELPVPPPRLQGFYHETVRAKLTQQFGLTNPHQIPTLEKIVIERRRRRSDQAAEGCWTSVVEELAIDHRASSRCGRRRRSRSPTSVCAQGQEIGAAVTLRGARMWEFLDRFIDGRDPAHPRLPRTRHAVVRRARQLLARRQGADDLPGDQLRR